MSLSPMVPPGTPTPLSPAEMDLLVARTGLTLNPGQMADLVLAWRQVAGLIATIPRSTALADDQAFVFRLPGPLATPAPKPSIRPKLDAKATARPKKPAKIKASKKPAAKTSQASTTKKPPPRKAAKPARKR
jgi:hypothetical protein